jgi:putative phosphoribosyl transferase
MADEVVAIEVPDDLTAVGAWYEDFEQVPDEDVVKMLAQAPAPRGGAEAPIEIASPAGPLCGDLAVPAGARGIVLFAHGSGSSRKSPRNRRVAAALRRANLGTLLLDLLTEAEERAEEAGGRRRFDVRMLADRLGLAMDALAARADTAPLPLGLFGASTGAAAAILAAVDRPGRVSAVVSRGGRPDLAGPRALSSIRAPVLLIVGGHDVPVLALHREAMRLLPRETRLEVVPGATHLFEEPGTLERVADLATAWFAEHLAGAGATRPSS